MAGSSLFALIDDIATLLDDIAVMTKTATGKTAGVLGDDLALNANQLTGLRAERELPVVWAVAKGSLLNKAILVPAALIISAIVPWLISPLLILGGLYLCFEGFEKIAHKWLGHGANDSSDHERMIAAAKRSAAELKAFEKNKIRGAIRTDFILSAEIIVIALGTVADTDFTTRVGVLILVALLITAGVYGLVAAIVKMDDAGLLLLERPRAVTKAVGKVLINTAPKLMKLLSIVGTAAMFMVGGGILAHGLPPLHTVLHSVHHSMENWGVGVLAEPLFGGVVGLVAGALVLVVVTLFTQVFERFRA